MAKTNPIRLIKFTIRFSSYSFAKISDIAKLHNRAIAFEIREAIDFYLDNHLREKDSVWQTPLERRIYKLENRLAGLMAKLIRVCGQSLWFSTLPYTKGGLPSKPLPQEAFQILWNTSRQFAAEWLKKARLDEETKKEEGAP